MPVAVHARRRSDRRSSLPSIPGTLRKQQTCSQSKRARNLPRHESAAACGRMLISAVWSSLAPTPPHRRRPVTLSPSPSQKALFFLVPCSLPTFSHFLETSTHPPCPLPCPFLRTSLACCRSYRCSASHQPPRISAHHTPTLLLRFSALRPYHRRPPFCPVTCAGHLHVLIL